MSKVRELRDEAAVLIEKAMIATYGNQNVQNYSNRYLRVRFPQPNTGPHYIRIQLTMEQ